MAVTAGQTVSHYRLVERIGQGGMGVVWRAEDTILRRTVAIKVLPADLALDEERRKLFLDEARLASSVSDAHIAQIHELGREGDLDFIVMEYVEGASLDRACRGRPLPPERVAAIGEQVARALARAHRKGLLHRDIKPGNILVTSEGEAKVVDFGLATLFREEHSSILNDLTTRSLVGASAPARIMGTVPYMSPEQLRREKLDSRSDIFSLGSVLYEMTAGRRPFRGDTNLEVATEIQKARPEPLRQLVPKVPMELERIVQKALAPRPAERYQTMDDMAVDLKRLSRDLESGSSPSFDELHASPAGVRRPWTWLAVGVGGLAALVVAGGFLMTRSRGAADVNTVLILPMEVRGQGEGSEYVGRAFAEAIAVQLAQAKVLNVLPVPDQNEVPDSGTQERAAAAVRLGAGRLVTGSLSREGKVIHTSLSLVDASQNRILWGMQRDEPDGSISSLAAVYASGIRAELGIAPSQMYEYPLYMTGRGAMATAAETTAVLGALRRYEIQPALDATERLIKAFPNDPDALALRAYAIFRTRSNLAPNALEDALKAVERVDPQNAAARNIRCELLLNDERKYQEAFECAAGLLSRHDLSPAARGWALRDRAAASYWLGDVAGAMPDLREASGLDPTNHFNFLIIGMSAMKVGDWDAARVALGQCTALVPGYGLCHGYLARTLHREGKQIEAVNAARKACEIDQDRAQCAYSAFLLAKAGKLDEARAALRRATTIEDPGNGGSYDVALAWLAIGDRTEALRNLRLFAKAPRGRKPEEDPDFSSLRGDPEFIAIINELKDSIARVDGR